MLQPNKQTAIYCRTASHDDFGFALDCQKLRLVRYAREHGYANPVVYMDNGFSGLTLDRPSFNEMQQLIREGLVSTVLVMDISRIGRKHIDVLRWIREMQEAGAKVITVDDPEAMGMVLNTAMKGGERT